MKIIKYALAAAVLGQLYSCNSGVKKVNVNNLNSLEEKGSYAIGAAFAMDLQRSFEFMPEQLPGADPEIIKAALLEYLINGSGQMDSATARATFEEFQKASIDKRRQADSMEGAQNLAAGQKFISDQLAANPNLKTTPSGLIYEVIKEGSGAKPTLDNRVSVIYKGTLIDGTVFDQTDTPREFHMRGVIRGWIEGLQLMSVGSKYRFIIPPDLAYGPQRRPQIDPQSTLVFEVELVDIKK